MKEYKKIYSNVMIQDAILGIEKRLQDYDNYNITLEKQDNDFYILTLSKNDYVLFKICNTLDCLYSVVNGYYRGIYDGTRRETK